MGKKMFYFGYDWILRNFKFSEIVMLLFLMMTTFSMMSGNVWGEEIYTYTDKEGTLFITNIYPEQNINFNTRNGNLYQDATAVYKDGTIAITNIAYQEKINFNTRNSSSSYQDSTLEKRLHWGRDNALIDEQKARYGQRKIVKNITGMDAGRYEVNIKKIASNLYQDFDTRIIIKTRACIELAGIDGSLLDWSGISGELFFKNTNKTCMVKKVYK
jgi:hypothetical protein